MTALLAALVGASVLAASPAAASAPTPSAAPAAAAAAPAAANPADVKWTWLDDRAQKLVYSSGWKQYNNLTVQQSKTATSTNVAGKTMTTTCMCSAFRWYSVKSPALGTAEVRVDGQLVTTASAYASSSATASTIVWASSIMAYGTHTLTLTTKTAWTEVDAIAVGVWKDKDCPGLSGQAATSSIEAAGWSLTKIHDGVTIFGQLGWHSGTSTGATPAAPVCVQIDNQSVQAMSGVTLYPAHPGGYTPNSSFGFPMAYSIQTATQPDFSDAVTVATRAETAADQGSRVDAARVITFGQTVSARYVRVVATTLGSIDYAYAMALAEIRPITATATTPLGFAGVTVTAQTGRELVQDIDATGSPEATEFSVVAGALPPGIDLANDGNLGRLSGRVDANATVGRYDATVQVTNAIGNVASAHVVIDVVGSAGPAVECPSYTPARVGESFSIPITVREAYGPPDVYYSEIPSFRLDFVRSEGSTRYYNGVGTMDEPGSYYVELTNTWVQPTESINCLVIVQG